MEKRDISQLISKIEQQTDAQILCILATRASHYPSVPWVYASVIALVLPLLLHFFTSFSYFNLYILQLLSFLSVFGLLQNESLRLFFTPHFHKKARLNQRVKDVLHTQLALNPKLKLVVIMVAQKERLALIESNMPLTLSPALHALTTQLGENKTRAIAEALAILLPQMQEFSPKTKDADFGLRNVIGD